MPPCEFEIILEGDYDPETPDLIGRRRTCNFLVKVVDESGAPIEGVEFKLEHSDMINFRISSAGETKVSTLEGTVFHIYSIWSPVYGDVEVSLSGHLPRALNKSYKVGWVCDFLSAVLRRYEPRGWVAFKHETLGHGRSVVTSVESDASSNPVVMVDFLVESKGWSASLPVVIYLDRIFLKGEMDADVVVGLAVDDLMSCSHAVALDGYLVVIPSTAHIGMTNM